MKKNEELVLRGVLVGERAPSDVVLREGTVVAVKRAGKGKADVGSATSIIGTTLFDIQVNGYGGVNLQGGKVTPEDVLAITNLLAAKGVSHWIPTLVTGAQADMEHGCRMMAEAMQHPAVKRAVPGMHLEGPYISPLDGPRGAHSPKHVRKPNIAEFDRCMKAADGKIAYVTIAPEVEGAVSFIKAVVKRGVVVSLGHHAGTPDDIAKAIDAGARLSTHLGNGMAAQINRHRNPLWPQLADDRLTASLIADLEHLPADVLKVFVRTKGPENVILTSDVVHIAGLKPGTYELGGMAVEMLPSGRVCLSGTELLAGSSLWLLQGLVNAVRVTDLTLEQAFACATTKPAKLFGLKHRFDVPKVGKKADLVVFDIDRAKAKWEVKVRGVWVDGGRV